MEGVSCLDSLILLGALFTLSEGREGYPTTLTKQMAAPRPTCVFEGAGYGLQGEASTTTTFLEVSCPRKGLSTKQVPRNEDPPQSENGARLPD